MQCKGQSLQNEERMLVLDHSHDPARRCIRKHFHVKQVQNKIMVFLLQVIIFGFSLYLFCFGVFGSCRLCFGFVLGIPKRINFSFCFPYRLLYIYIILIFCRGFVSSLFCFFLFFLHVAKLSSSGSLHAFTSERDPCRDRLVGEAVRLTSQKSKY